MIRRLTLACLLCTVPGTALAATLPPVLSSQEDAGSESALKERPVNRLLYLENGRVLRVKARLIDGRWEVRSGGDVKHIPAREVRASRLERELLADLKRKHRKLSRDTTPEDLEERAKVASWSANNGLVPEALRDLDKVLAANPDQPTALEALEGLPATFRLPALGGSPTPEAIESFVKAASKSSASLRETAARALAASGPRQAELLRTLLRTSLHHPLRDRRRFAALAARRVFGEDLTAHPALASALIRSAAYDRDMDVREECARALRDTREPALIIPLMRALESNSLGLRRNSAEALAVAGYPVAIAPLVASLSSPPQSGGGSKHGPVAHVAIGTEVAYVRDVDLEIAQGASIGDPIIGSIRDAVVFEVRANGGSTVTYGHYKRSARQALERLTGERARDWAEWLEKQR